MDNLAHLHTASKWILTFCMLCGRLEICTLLILFGPEFWRKCDVTIPSRVATPSESRFGVNANRCYGLEVRSVRLKS